MDSKTPRPTEITLHQQSGVLDVAFDDGTRFAMPVEYLRVFSPSAEVRGHGPGQEVLQAGKRAVGIKAIEPVGVYAGRDEAFTGAGNRDVHDAVGPNNAGGRSEKFVVFAVADVAGDA